MNVRDTFMYLSQNGLLVVYKSNQIIKKGKI